MKTPDLKGKSLVGVLRQSGNVFGDKVFMKSFVDGRFVDFSFKEFETKAERIARGLISLGLKKGDRVALLSENRPDWGASYIGVLMAGGINVPLDALLKLPAWSHILRSSGSRMLIVSKNFLPDFELAMGDLGEMKTLICMDSCEPGSKALSLDDLVKKGDLYSGKLPDVNEKDTAAIIYTSGTTGQAKGVVLSNENIVSDIDGSLTIINIQENDNFLSVLPIHHTFECTGGFLVPMASGCCITYARGLASKLILEDIKNNQATILLGVPLLFEKMHDGIFKAISKKPPITRAIFAASFSITRLVAAKFLQDPGKRIFRGLREKAGLSSLRLMIAGGAPMPPDVSKTFNLLGFRFIQGYGLTESSPILTLNPVDNYREGSIGTPIKGATLKIIDADSRGIGQIVAKGPMIMQGYFNNPEATKEVLRDGWLYTGDSGWVDTDGFYYIAGRLKNVIVTPAGKNVYPEEIEAVVVPDYEYFNTLADESGHNFDTDEIEKKIKSEVQALSAGLAEFKKVKYIQIREDEFEKTSTRKIKRYLFTRKFEPVSNKAGKGRT